jgi:hypothetical protein
MQKKWLPGSTPQAGSSPNFLTWIGSGGEDFERSQENQQNCCLLAFYEKNHPGI